MVKTKALDFYGDINIFNISVWFIFYVEIVYHIDSRNKNLKLMLLAPVFKIHYHYFGCTTTLTRETSYWVVEIGFANVGLNKARFIPSLTELL